MKFKVGDKVRVVKDTLEGEMDGYTGVFVRYDYHDDSFSITMLSSIMVGRIGLEKKSWS
ncbi:hypothetical protein NQL38_002455 [Providencia rettgeri]|nr:hypothetical protein [Providencia rettgeri]